MRLEPWDFRNAHGERLSGRLDLPDGTPRAWAVFAHCFTCGKDMLAARRVAAGLAARGVATLRFDFTGLGGSEGDFANSGFSANVADIVAATAQLGAEGRAPTLLIGHSLGGAAVLAAAAGIPEVRAVAVIGAPFSAAHLLDTLGAQLGARTASGETQITIAGRSFTLGQDFADDLRRQDQRERIARLGKALLILHAPEDAVVGIGNARAIFDAARHPKSFVALDKADHLLTRPQDADFVAKILAAWLPRYLDPLAAAMAAAPGSATVTVTETGRGRFQQRVEAGGHVFLADEPVAAGGLGSGPNPYDLLLAALGACTAMTLRLYAERKSWPLERVRVALDHHRIHAEDCADCETKLGLVDEIARQIEITGPLDDEQLARLLAIADRCPVHKTLTSEIVIRTSQTSPQP